MKKWISAFLRRHFKKSKKQSGQAIVEFLLVFMLTIGLARFVFFHKTYGIQGVMESTMMKLGAYLERDLKSGTKPGDQGQDSTDVFAGVVNWKN